jgi:hypothetical protein
MKKSRSSIVSALGILGISLVACVYSHPLSAAPFLERDGQYEINWTTGKIRFYGVAKMEASEDSLRPAEQRAWADGLRLAEHNIPILMSSRLGGAKRINTEKISKLATDTNSVNTTYFGDTRVKVILETSIQKMTPQLLSPVAALPAVSGAGGGLVIKLPKGVKPAAFVSILDEHGREMVSANLGVGAAQGGASMVKWFKTEVGAAEGRSIAQAPVISGTSTERGVIRINSMDWKADYAQSIAQGNAAIVIQ